MRISRKNERTRFPELEALYEQAVSDLLRPISDQDRKKLTAFCLAYRKEVDPYQTSDRLNIAARKANEPIRFFSAHAEPLRLVVPE